MNENGGFNLVYGEKIAKFTKINFLQIYLPYSIYIMMMIVREGGALLSVGTK